jgi:hypothetical protein
MEADDRYGPLAAASEDAEGAVGKRRLDPAAADAAVDPVKQPREAAGEQPREPAAARREAAVCPDQMCPPLHRHARKMGQRATRCKQVDSPRGFG